MGALSPALLKHSEHIHEDHGEFMRRLTELDTALDDLVCHAEVFADLGSSAHVRQVGCWFNDRLAVHHEYEEKTVLAALARMRPDLAAFAREMKKQHKEIGQHVQDLCTLVQALQTASDLEQAITTLKDRGKDLTRFMSLHMGAEERKMSSLQA